MKIMDSELAQQTVQYLEENFSGWEYQVSFHQKESTMLRFAQSNVHQNNRSIQTSTDIELAQGKRVAKTSLDTRNIDEVIRSIQSLQGICETIAENNEFSGYPLPPLQIDSGKENPVVDAKEFYEKSLSFFPSYFQKIKNASLEAYGSFLYENFGTACVNSNGLQNESHSSFVQFQSQIMKDRVSGYSQTTAKTIQDLSIDRVIEESLETCLKGTSPSIIEPGYYPVFLKPEAVSDILRMMAFISMGTKSIDEKRSYLSEKLNTQVLDSCLDITENPLHPEQISMYMDHQGYPHIHPVQLIQKGVFRDMVFDDKFAKKYHKPNTGNALPGNMGPIPTNLVLESATTQDPGAMISQVEKGIYVTRFWYANPVSPIDGEVTALTRDGTFLIEKGQLKPIKNLRYSDNIFEVLSNIVAVGSDSRFNGSFYGGTVAPSLLCKKMRFTEVLPE
ncbi:MAG: metallopeptidase TldD-related protein [Caldisericia bacterium]|nr:metallopeptidase TldD-related protein [Caldisericia bacterium]MDD4614125.1 metallopeptidase TldD-related protein [Caldisericia bacterium]